MSTYNGERFLDQQLESIYNQTLGGNIVVYIRDDGSFDKTLEIIDSWKDKININLQKGKNIGPAQSFWKLMLDTDIQADYYAFCDQDDLWDANKMQIAINTINRLNVDFYACNCRIIDNKGEILTEISKKCSPEISLQYLFAGGVTQGCSTVFTNKLRNYIQSLEISCIPLHDIITMIYASAIGTIAWDQEPRFGYRIHENNVASKAAKSPLNKLKSIKENYKRGSQNSNSIVAMELLQNVKDLSEDDIAFLQMLRDYKLNIKNTLKAMHYFDNSRISKKALNSYKLRVLLRVY